MFILGIKFFGILKIVTKLRQIKLYRIENVKAPQCSRLFVSIHSYGCYARLEFLLEIHKPRGKVQNVNSLLKKWSHFLMLITFLRIAIQAVSLQHISAHNSLLRPTPTIIILGAVSLELDNFESLCVYFNSGPSYPFTFSCDWYNFWCSFYVEMSV